MVAVFSGDEVEEHFDNLDTSRPTLLYNVENHITSENESFHCVVCVND